jgi:VanZ family protein
VAATRAVRLWAPVVVWAALIFALSSIPSLSTGLGLWDTILRKCAHTVEYAVLGALLLRTRLGWRSALALGIAYAASDEVHQRFVRGRHASPVDVGIDSIGLAIGILVACRASSWAR